LTLTCRHRWTKAAAGRQKLPGRLAVAGTKRQACRQPAGRYEAEGGSQVGAGRGMQAVMQKQSVRGRQRAA
jgi:hypothetical protein